MVIEVTERRFASQYARSEREEVDVAVTVVSSRCPQNHSCPAVRACPSGALSQRINAAPVVDSLLCTDCGRCLFACASGALRPMR